MDVLVLSYNTRGALRQTLSTLRAHPPDASVEVKVWVFDNGSSDGSPEMVVADFPEVELVRAERNLGFAKGNNALAARSSGEYVLLLNSDVIVQTDVVTPLLHALSADPQILLASPRLVGQDGSVQFSAQRLPSLAFELASVIRGKRVGRVLRPVFDSDALVRDVLQVDETVARGTRDAEFIWATCWLLRRADLPSGTIFDQQFPMYDEDLDFCRRARGAARTLRYVADVELVHIGGASSPTTAHKLALMSRARRRYYARHHGRLVAGAYAVGIPSSYWLTRGVQRIPKPSWLSLPRVG